LVSDEKLAVVEQNRSAFIAPFSSLSLSRANESLYDLQVASITHIDDSFIKSIHADQTGTDTGGGYIGTGGGYIGTGTRVIPDE
jgi:hypothetical protein